MTDSEGRIMADGIDIARLRELHAKAEARFPAGATMRQESERHSARAHVQHQFPRLLDALEATWNECKAWRNSENLDHTYECREGYPQTHRCPMCENQVRIASLVAATDRAIAGSEKR